jgi:acetoacetate decarboxylase
MTRIEDLKGFCYPMTPGGKSSIVGELPWHYAADFLYVIYESDSQAVADFIPEPLKPGIHPNRVCVSFSKWWSLWDNQLDMASINPELTLYTEMDIFLGFEFKGEQGMICVYAWVDNDYTMLRGHFMGYPKKLGTTYMTDFHPLNPKMEPLGIGSKLKAFTTAHGERVAEGTLEITEKITPEALPKPLGFPICNIRHFPSIIPGTPPCAHDLIRMTTENFKIGEVWKGDATIALLPSKIEEHTHLVVKEVVGGYYYSFGQTTTGAEVLHSWI